MQKKERRKQQLDELEREVESLRHLSGDGAQNGDLEALREQVSELRREFYTHLGAWQRTQLARHPQRPYTLDFVRLLFTDFSELHGDRAFGDDPAIVGGFAKFKGRHVLVLGHQKGRDTKQRVARNFGQAKPEGYRKALRLMKLAAKYGRPIFTFVDTPGAYPGLDAEERGQAEAIAVNLRAMSRLPVPIVVTITGEGGAHTDHEAAAQMLEPVLVRALDDLCAKPVPELLERRYAKFRRMGQLAGAVSG